MRSTSCFLIFALALTSCTSLEVKKDVTPPPVIVTTPPPLPINLDLKFNEDLNKVWVNYFTEDFTDSRAMTVFVVTNRDMKQANTVGCGDEYFGVNSSPVTKSLTCRLNIPKNHSTGEIKSTNDHRKSSHEFFKVINSQSLDSDRLVESLKKSQRVPLVFVHGFNVKFQEAIFRASQIAYDLKYQGPIILFSWPAGAGDSFLDDKLVNRTYISNSQTAKDSIIVFKDFIKSLSNSGIKVNLFVHSMGHQVVLPALSAWSKESNAQALDKKVINEFILNAPDFEASKFQELANNLKSFAKRTTLYCSFNDNALIASEVMNKNKRLGACTNIENVDTINVSLVDAPSMGIVGLGHGYYSSRPVLTDVFQVLLGIDVEKRLFIRKSEPNSTEKYYLRP